MPSSTQRFEVLLVVAIFLSLQTPGKLKFGLQRSVWLSLDLVQSKSAAHSSSRTRTFSACGSEKETLWGYYTVE